MGIHSGPVSRVVDVNDRSNAAGAGINIAQRVMSCGDVGHILLSKRSADDLVEYSHWRPYLHEIGECLVKHGAKVSLVNLYKDDVGNPELPAQCKESARVVDEAKTSRRIRKIATALAAAALIVLSFVVYAMFAKPDRSPALQSVATRHIPPKSIAVLPFENLSDDKQSGYFADGVQDEIITDSLKSQI